MLGAGFHPLFVRGIDRRQDEIEGEEDPEHHERDERQRKEAVIIIRLQVDVGEVGGGEDREAREQRPGHGPVVRCLITLGRDAELPEEREHHHAEPHHEEGHERQDLLDVPQHLKCQQHTLPQRFLADRVHQRPKDGRQPPGPQRLGSSARRVIGRA